MIKMATGEVPIHISNKNPKTFTSSNYNTFNRATLAKLKSPNVSTWDMVIVSAACWLRQGVSVRLTR